MPPAKSFPLWFLSQCRVAAWGLSIAFSSLLQQELKEETKKLRDGVAGAVDSRLEGIWILGHEVPLNNCLVVNFLVPGFLSCAVKGFGWISVE